MNKITILKNNILNEYYCIDDIISITNYEDTLIRLMVCNNKDIDIIDCEATDIILITFGESIDCKIKFGYRSDLITYVDFIKIDLHSNYIYLSSTRCNTVYKFIEKIIIL